jgi:rhodanese-related sulfurtransferase
MTALAKQFGKLITAAIVLMLLPVLSSAQSDIVYRSPESVDGAITISVEQAKSLFDQGVKFIDVRSPRLYARKHIPGAHHLDFKAIFSEQALASMADRDEPLVIYCTGVKCSRSSRASAMAASWGFNQIHYFRGGIVEWKNAGYPTETGKSLAMQQKR